MNKYQNFCTTNLHFDNYIIQAWNLTGDKNNKNVIVPKTQQALAIYLTHLTWQQRIFTMSYQMI